VVTPGTDFSKLYLLAVREAAGGFAGTVGYMVKPCITVIVYGRICACLYHRGEALALKHGAGGCGSAFPSTLMVIGLVALVGGWEGEPAGGSTALKAQWPRCRWRLKARPGLMSPKCRQNGYYHR
jgi:hypothetical protein